MFKKINLLLVAISLASCVPLSETLKSKLEFKEKNEKEKKDKEKDKDSGIDPAVTLSPAELKVSVRKILDTNCLSCHGAGQSFQSLANLAPSISVIEKDPTLISPKDLENSYLYQQVTVGSMKNFLQNPNDADIIKAWILSLTPEVIDTKAPIILSFLPNGSTYEMGITSVKLNVVTDEASSCGFSQSSANVNYSQMTKFTGTGDKAHTYTVIGLNAGNYSYFVKCMDPSNNVSLAKEIKFSIKVPVDSKAPLITSFLPNGTIYEASITSVKLDVVTDEASSCGFSTNAANLDYNQMTKFTGTGDKNHSYTSVGLSAGSYSYFVRCMDPANNVSLTKEIKFSIKVPVDSKAPLITSFLPNGTIYEAGVTSVKLDVVTDEASSCGFSTNSANLDYNQMTKFSGTGDKAHAYTATNLKTGSYSYFVKCMDPAKNVSLAKEIKFSIKLPVDSKAPVITSFLPNGSDYDMGTTIVSLNVVTDEAAACSFSTTSTNLDYNQMTKFTVTGDQAHTYTASNLKAGSYSYFVKCMDPTKNISLVKEIKFSIKAVVVPPAPTPPDTKAPIITSFLPNGSIYEVGVTSANLNVVTDEASSCGFSTVSASVDYNQMIKFTVTGNQAHSHTVSNLKAGSHSYFVKCMDPAKNVSLFKEIKFSIKEVPVDTKAPIITSFLPNGSTYESTVMNVKLDVVTDEASSCGFSTTSSSVNYNQMTKFTGTGDLAHTYTASNLKAGSYSYFVKCMDPATNVSLFKEIKFVIKVPPDTKAPIITSFLPNGSTYESTVMNVKLDVVTDEASSCGFSTTSSSVNYNQMTKFTGTGDLAHTYTASNLKAGNYSYFVKCMDPATNVSLFKEIKFVIKVPPDTKAPIITSFLPNGSIYEAGVTSVKLDVVTDEASSCGFSTTSASVDYNQMTKFTGTGDLAHTYTASNLTAGSYSYFVKCMDPALNVSLFKEIKFNIKVVVKLTPAELKVAVRKILDTNCLVCHGAGKSFQSIANLAPSIEVIEKDPTLVSPQNLANSFLYQQVTVGKMKTYLPDPKDAEIIKDWILSLIPPAVDNMAPTITSFTPNGSIYDIGVTNVKLDVVTDESASCGFSTSAGSLDYNQMTKFTVTGAKAHSHTATNLQAGNYSYFVKCMDAAKNVSVSKEIKFSIKGVVPPPVEAPGPTDYNSQIQMANRSYVESVLSQVFDIKGSSLESYIKTNIYDKVEFGGACDYYSASGYVGISEYPRELCSKDVGIDVGIVQPSNNNPMRYALTAKACEKLVIDSGRLNAVRNKIYSDQKWGVPTNEKILVAWHLFHQASDTDTSVLTGLKDISSATTNNDEAWKIIILTICMSPEWQVL